MWQVMLLHMRLYIFGMQSRYLSEDNRAGGTTIIDNINFCRQNISFPVRSYLEFTIYYFAGHGIHLISCGNIKESNTIKLLDVSCETVD